MTLRKHFSEKDIDELFRPRWPGSLWTLKCPLYSFAETTFYLIFIRDFSENTFICIMFEELVIYVKETAEKSRKFPFREGAHKSQLDWFGSDLEFCLDRRKWSYCRNWRYFKKYLRTCAWNIHSHKYTKKNHDNCLVLSSILAQRECQSSLLLLSFEVWASRGELEEKRYILRIYSKHNFSHTCNSHKYKFPMKSHEFKSHIITILAINYLPEKNWLFRGLSHFASPTRTVLYSRMRSLIHPTILYRSINVSLAVRLSPEERSRRFWPFSVFNNIKMLQLLIWFSSWICY